MTDIIELAKKFARSITIIGGGYNDKVNAMEDNYRLMFHNDEIRAFADAIRQDQIEKDGWHFIDKNTPRDDMLLFIVVPKPKDMCWTDTSGNPIFSTNEPYIKYCKFAEWSSTEMAVRWCAVPHIHQLTKQVQVDV